MEKNTITEHLTARSNGTAAKTKLGEKPAALSFQAELPINSSLFGLLVFLGTEAMFFAGLISAFLILRAGSGAWPPADQPRLPVEVTAINTLVLLTSAYTMHRGVKAIRSGQQKTLTRWLALTGVLGTVFLGVQGVEWVRLVSYGLTFTSSLYGATFYTLIGCHGMHVLAAVIVLLIVFSRALNKSYSATNHAGLELCQVYWFFVAGIWPVLYVLVYLS
jgi:heme/copper-type cytochrome/quinol oxidase subunit 3